MLELCTLFDHQYLARGLALHSSLKRLSEPYRLWILCMDEVTMQSLKTMNLDSVELLTVEDLARFDERVNIARETRSPVEFFFTAKSFLCSYLLTKVNDLSLIVYVDADTYFFSSIQQLGELMEGKSIGISPHRFPPELRHLQEFGTYNAGLVIFRADIDGRKCLAWWTDRCFEWCNNYVDEGRYADQKYLEAFPVLFSGVLSLDHKGINLAPWNVRQYRLTEEVDQLKVDGDPLILFHFHGLKRMGDNRYDSGLVIYQTHLKGVLRTRVYQPYLIELAKHEPVLWHEQAIGHKRSIQPNTLIPKALRAMARAIRRAWYNPIISL